MLIERIRGAIGKDGLWPFKDFEMAYDCIDSEALLRFLKLSEVGKS